MTLRILYYFIQSIKIQLRRLIFVIIFSFIFLPVFVLFYLGFWNSFSNPIIGIMLIAFVMLLGLLAIITMIKLSIVEIEYDWIDEK